MLILMLITLKMWPADEDCLASSTTVRNQSPSTGKELHSAVGQTIPLPRRQSLRKGLQCKQFIWEVIPGNGEVGK